MRISRRPSGGRGEYEISEDLGAITPHSLVDHEIYIHLGTHIFRTGAILREQGGKRRLRLLDRRRTIHPHRQVAAALLMPAPVRAEVALGAGQPILKSDRYAVEHIAIKEVELINPTHAVLRLGEITLRNFNLHAETLNTETRLAQVEFLWHHADELPAEIAQLLHRHRILVTAGTPVPKEAEELVGLLQNVLTDTGGDYGIFRQGGEDVLPDLLRTLQLAAEPPQPPIMVEEVDPDELEIKRRTVREWRRWAASRGAKSARFRQQVREAYNWTCLVCGSHYPRTPFNRVAGVDGAHILPWADYDLDEVVNGLCLCRLHHWAFDEGLLVIRPAGGGYVVEIPEFVQAGIQADYPEFSLEELVQWEGPVAEERLPADLRLRPHPQLLTRLYELLFQ